MKDHTRKYIIIIGSKAFFENSLCELYANLMKGEEGPPLHSFLEQVRLSDEGKQRGQAFGEKALALYVKNDHYHGIVETAHDRLGAIIEELTEESATVYVHNPPSTLENYLKDLMSRQIIELTYRREIYKFQRDECRFHKGMDQIFKRIYGQNEAIAEVSKSIWYMARVNRIKPYVIMLYGGSSLGKSELVREISKHFFDGKLVEKHLSMFKNDTYSYYFFGDRPNRKSLGFDLLERESNLLFLDEMDKCPDHFYSAFYTLFDNTVFLDATYELDISGLLIMLTSNYGSEQEMKERLGLPIFYRIDKFVHFKNLDERSIYDITMNEIYYHEEECAGLLSADQIYCNVCHKIKTSGENARTIKSKVQETVEDLLFDGVVNLA